MKKAAKVLCMVSGMTSLSILLYFCIRVAIAKMRSPSIVIIGGPDQPSLRLLMEIMVFGHPLFYIGCVCLLVFAAVLIWLVSRRPDEKTAVPAEPPWTL